MNDIGRLLILGDSYSTFAGHIPEGYLSYYSKAHDEGTDIRKVEQTWWHQLVKESEAELVLNSSYSGSTICNTGYNGADFSNISFIGRLDKLISDGFFEKNTLDTVMVFGGTNDSWANSPMGELKYDGQTEEELFSALPAVGYLMRRLRAAVSDAKIFVIINTGLKAEVENALCCAAEKYGAKTIKLFDIAKTHGHPTIEGMRQIKTQILEKIGE